MEESFSFHCTPESETGLMTGFLQSVFSRLTAALSFPLHQVMLIEKSIGDTLGAGQGRQTGPGL